MLIKNSHRISCLNKNHYKTLFFLSNVILFFICADRSAIASQLIASVVSSGSVYRTTGNSYGSSSTLRMGQDDVPLNDNSFYRGYAVFDLSSLPTGADISKVRLRFDCTWVDTADPEGVAFDVEIGPLTVSKTSWDNATSQDRWRVNYTDFYSRSYFQTLWSSDIYNDVYISLNSSAISTIASKGGDYVVFHFRLTTQNYAGELPWPGDAYHNGNQIPDWARLDNGWDIYDLQGSDDDWLTVFSDLHLVIDYTTPTTSTTTTSSTSTTTTAASTTSTTTTTSSTSTTTNNVTTTTAATTTSSTTTTSGTSTTTNATTTAASTTTSATTTAATTTAATTTTTAATTTIATTTILPTTTTAATTTAATTTSSITTTSGTSTTTNATTTSLPTTSTTTTSGSTSTTAGVLLIKKCTVIAGKYINEDKISVSGIVDVNSADLSGANDVNVRIGNVYEESINTSLFKAKNGKYTYTYRIPKGGEGGITSLVLDTNKHTFSLKVQKVDLTGLHCPFDIEFDIGNYQGVGSVDEKIANGKKFIPVQLMSGVEDYLQVQSVIAKKGKSSDTLTVKGGIALENPLSPISDVNLCNVNLALKLGNQTFTIPAGNFKSSGKSGLKFVCKNAKISEGGIANGTFDFGKCTFSISIKNTTIISQTGKVRICLEIGTFLCIEYDLDTGQTIY